MIFDEEQMFEYLGDISYDASDGDSAKQIAKTLQSNHPEISASFGSRDLVEFIINFIGALDLGQSLKTAQKYEKKLYKQFPDWKYLVQDFIESYSDMEVMDDGSEFAAFWSKS